MADQNQPIIDEFRANDGRVGGGFEGRTLLLLHHRGAKTGTERVKPVDASVEIRTDAFRVRARVAAGEEREQIWERQKHDWPGFADYEAKTQGIREIPVIVLEKT